MCSPQHIHPKEERVSFGAFDIIIVVDWYNHEVAAVGKVLLVLVL